MVSWWFRLGRGRIYPLGCCCIFQRTWPQKSVWLPRIQQNNTYPIWKSHWIFWNTPHVFRTSLKSTSLCQVQHSTKILYEWLFVLLDPTPANLASFLPSQQHPERQAPKHTTFHWYIQKHNKKTLLTPFKSLGFKYSNTVKSSWKLAGPMPLGGASLHPRSEHCTPRPLPDP